MNIAFGITTSKEHETRKTFAADVDSLPAEAAGVPGNLNVQGDASKCASIREEETPRKILNSRVL
jgi:hypothetical protein